MSTGGGFGTRQQYTNHEEAIFWSARPIILNGIPDFVKRSDLLDRTFIAHLPFIPPADRKTEKEILAAFDKLRPALLGAVLDAAVLALKKLPDVSLSKSPRMADFAKWTAAIAPALEADPSDMARILMDMQDEALLSKIDTPLPQAVLKLLEARGGKFEGYLIDLVDELAKHAPANVTAHASWPRNSKALQNAMARIAPILRAAKVEYQELERTNRGRLVLLECLDPELSDGPGKCDGARRAGDGGPSRVTP